MPSPVSDFGPHTPRLGRREEGAEKEAHGVWWDLQDLQKAVKVGKRPGQLEWAYIVGLRAGFRVDARRTCVRALHSRAFAHAPAGATTLPRVGALIYMSTCRHFGASSTVTSLVTLRARFFTAFFPAVTSSSLISNSPRVVDSTHTYPKLSAATCTCRGGWGGGW